MDSCLQKLLFFKHFPKIISSGECNKKIHENLYSLYIAIPTVGICYQTKVPTKYNMNAGEINRPTTNRFKSEFSIQIDSNQCQPLLRDEDWYIKNNRTLHSIVYPVTTFRYSRHCWGRGGRRKDSKQFRKIILCRLEFIAFDNKTELIRQCWMQGSADSKLH